MEIIILQENLKKGLNTVYNIIGKNLTLPVLNNILFTVEKKQLKLTSTDLEIAIDHWIPCKVKKEGKITIPAKLFNDLVNNLPDKKINIKQKNNNILEIKCDNFNSTVNTITHKEFPIIPKLKEKTSFKIKALDFKEGLSRVVNFTSLSDIRPEISGIFIKINKNEVKFVSTDSFRLGEKTISIKENKNNIKKSVILPLKTTQELIRILEDSKKSDDLEIIIEKNQILFKTPNTKVISRLIEGNYPNYEQLIPKKSETNLILSRKELLNSVKVSSLFSSKINDLRVKVIPKKSIVEIFSQDAEKGENISKIEGEIEGKEIEILFNHKYLLDGLNNISSEKVVLGLNGESNPGILKPAGDKNFIYVIMPIKL